MATPIKKEQAEQVLVILVTVANRKDAVRIGHEMVQMKLAACANVIPGIQSIYRWKGKVVKAQEVLLILKLLNLGIMRSRKPSRRCMPMRFLRLSLCQLPKALRHMLGG